MDLVLNIKTATAEIQIDCSEDILDEYLDGEGYPMSVLEQLQAAIAEQIGTQEYTIEDFANEYEGISLETVAEFLEGYFEHGEPWAAYVAIHGMDYMDQSSFTDSYYGEVEDLDDLVDDYLEGLECHEALLMYIDREKILNDLMIDTYTSHEFDYSSEIYVFRNC